MSRVLIKNANLITMDEKFSGDCMIIDNGKILAVGKEEKLILDKVKGADVVDMKGATILPGFIDPHGHFFISAMAHKLFADVSCYPIGKIRSISMLIHSLRNYGKAHPGKDPIIGFGFDDTLAEEYRMPTAEDLDQVSAERSVIVLHTSLHMLSANTTAMRKAGIVDCSFQPECGRVYYENGRPNGIFEESDAMMPIVKKVLSAKMVLSILKAMEEESERYLQKGITTVCEGAGNMAGIYKLAYKCHRMKNRAIVCQSLKADGKLPSRITFEDGKRLIDGPVKLIADGSIQAYTAYLTIPYYQNHPTRPKPEGYCGNPGMPKEKLEQALDEIGKAGRAFAVHCNGDAALDMVLDAFSKALHADKEARNLIIHCQTAREDQLDRMKELGMLPSFFPAHVYVWGDSHVHTFLGAERGSRIDPVGSAVGRQMCFTLHNDAPVTEPSPLTLIWNTVCRTTQKGAVIAPEQCISVYEALKGVTCNAAFQYGIEGWLGTLTPGKRADFVVLDRNILTVPAEELRNIEIAEVWVDGKRSL